MNSLKRWELTDRQQKTFEKELAHARLWLMRVQQWSEKFTTEEAPENLGMMDAKINNIEAAFQRTCKPEQLDQPELARDLAIALSDYYDKRGRWDDWIKLGPLGLNACLRLGDDYSLKQAYPSICNGIGLMHRMLGNSGEAMLFYKQAFDRVSKDEIRSDCLTNMADIYRLQGNHEKALACAQQAVELGQRTGDQSREAKGLEYLGLTYISCKRYDEGIDCYKQALQLRQETANLPRIAMVLAFLAFALTNRGSQQDLKQALQYHKQAYEIELKLQNRQSIARYFGDVAVLYNKLGEYEKAIENSEMALHYNEDMGFLRGAALNHVRLAHSYQGLGQLDRMLFHVEKALELEKYLTAFDRNLSRFIEVLIASVRYLHKLGRGLKAKEYAELVINLFKDSEDSDALEGIEQLLKQLERDD